MKKKRGIRKNKGKFSLVPFIIFMSLLSILEGTLILFGVIQPIASYSIPNILFSFLKIALVVYVSITFLKGQIKNSALAGGILGGISVVILSVFSLISRVSFKVPIFGVAVTGNSYFISMFVVILENIILYAVISLVAGFIAGKFRKN